MKYLHEFVKTTTSNAFLSSGLIRSITTCLLAAQSSYIDM